MLNVVAEEWDRLKGFQKMNEMLLERRDWIMDQRVFTSFQKIPENLNGFYERNKTDEEKVKVDEVQQAKKVKKDKSIKKKDGKKKKKGKGAKAEETRVYIGPSEVNNKFEYFDAEYKAIWENRDEDENYRQEYDKKLIKQEVKPAILHKYQQDIDDMILCELDNLRLMSGTSKKKKGKKKKKKSKKKAKKKGLKLPGYKLIKDYPIYELLRELIGYNIVKKLPAENLVNFLGEFNYIHSMLDDIKDK